MESGGAEPKKPLHGFLSRVKIRETPVRIVTRPSNAVNAFKKGLGNSEHECCFPAPHAPTATYGVSDVVEVTSDPVAMAELGVDIFRVARKRSDECDILSVCEG